MHRFLAELNMYCASQPQVPKVTVERLSNSSGDVSSLLSSFFDPCLYQAEGKEGRYQEWKLCPQRLLTSPSIHKIL